MTKKQKKELRKIIIAACIFFPLLILKHTGVPAAVFGNRWVSLIVFLVPYFIVGGSVVKRGLLGIRNRQAFDEAFLMLLATIGAFATGEYSEACAVMLFYQVGEFFQSYAVGKSRKSIRELMDIAPEFANVEREDGTIETVDPDEVETGDVLIIKPGEKIPVDSTILEGSSMINTSALTGESVPRSAHPGDAVISGCINGDGLLKVRADKIYDDSTVARILEMVESASEKKSRTENFITRFARYYTPIVVYAAIALAVIPSIVFGSPLQWIYRACTFLVISCPCALVISVPLAFFGGIGAASKVGVLVKGSNYLELMAKLDTVVSDKTGTLTEGNFRVSSLECAEGVTEEELLIHAALAEETSTHPIAKSIREAFEQRGLEELTAHAKVIGAENITGHGIIAEVSGLEVCGKADQPEGADQPEETDQPEGKDERTNCLIYAGNEKLMRKYNIDFRPSGDGAATVVYIACGSRCLGSVSIRDEVKPEAKKAIADMKTRGVRRFIMLTGDRKNVGDAVGRELGIDEVFSELFPQDKVSKVEEIMDKLDKKQKLAFIGDGINDAPVLSRADVGIAMGSMGSDAAIEAADVVIMDDDLNRIGSVMKVAKRTLSIAMQNIVFAMAVKIAILILGALGLANMWAAVFGDVGVAVICILNSMRLLNTKKTI